MATHDYIISNASGAAVRADLNNALAAIVTNNSSATAPTTTYAYQWWADTGSSPAVMKLRNAANSAWITLFQLDGEWSLIPFENGTAAAPSIYFKDSGTDTGIFSPGTDQVGITTGGSVRLTTSTTAFTGTLPWQGQNGTAAAPALSFSGDPNTGIYNVGADQLGISTNGTLRFDVSTTATTSTLPVVHPLGAVGTPSITFTGDLNTGIYSPAADTLAFVEGGAEAARIDSSGRLLVGATTATNNLRFDEKLAIVGNTAGGSGYVGAGFTYYGTTAGTAPILEFNRSRGTTDGSYTEVISDDWLGLINFRGADGAGWSDAAWIYAVADGDWTTSGDTTDSPGRLVFATAADGASSPTERMRIVNGGNVLINTTNNSARLAVATDIVNTAGNRVALFSGTATGDAAYESLGVSKFDNNSTTAQIFQRFYINNGVTGCGQINANGASSAAFGTFSDSRLKENIEDLPSQLQNVCNLRPVEFDYKDGSGHQIGFIAQEMEEVYPDAVAEDSDGMLTITGWSKTEARLVKALQEAIAKIETLETKVAALEAA